MLKNPIEKNKEHCSHFSADTKDIMVDPLKFYDSDKTDLFLSAPGDVFKVNVIVLQSVDARCCVVNLLNEENLFKESLYFARSLSLHIDPVIPCEKLQRISNVNKIYFSKITQLSIS